MGTMAPYTHMTYSNPLEMSLGVQRRVGFKPDEPQHWCGDKQTLVDARTHSKRALHHGSQYTDTSHAPYRKCEGCGCSHLQGGQMRQRVAGENDHGSWECSVFSPKNCAYCPPVLAGCHEAPSRSNNYKRMVMERWSGH